MVAVRGPVGERRRGARQHGPVHGIVAARIRPGHPAEVLDVSALGLHLETARRLLPGTAIDLYLERADGVAVVRARVCRCAVAAVSANRLWYRAAAAFEVPLAWFAESSTLAAIPQDRPSRSFPDEWVGGSRKRVLPSAEQERTGDNP